MEDKKMCSAVIVAAGRGKRFGADVPKQFLELDGKPLLYYTLKAFCDSDIIDEVILVTSEEWIDYCTEDIVKKYGFDKVDGVVLGGEERYDSVKAGVMVCDIASDYVFIHDGARPLVTEEIIKRGYETVLKYDTAVAAVPVTDTIKEADKDRIVISTPDRKSLWSVQTPQIFKYELILKAYLSMTSEDTKDLTDDAMLVERKTNVPVHLFEASPDNIKVTSKSDVELIKLRLNKK